MQIKKPVRWPIEVGDSDVRYFSLYFATHEDDRYVVGTLGDVGQDDPVLLRIESACIFGHVFRGVHCDCGSQWKQALARIIDEGSGMVVYAIDDDARGHGIETHFELYVRRQYEGADEEEIFEEWGEPMDVRDYAPVVEVLERFEVDAVRLMTNNPDRIAALESAGIEVVERIPLEATITEYNHQLLLQEKEWIGYETSYRTHAEWFEEFRDRSGAATRGYMLVAGYREVVDEGYGEAATACDPAVDRSDDFLTLYATGSTVEAVDDSTLDAVDVVVDVTEETPTELQSVGEPRRGPEH